jgi:hypothetical protein
LTSLSPKNRQLPRIPKSFELGPHTYTVHIVSDKEMREACRRHGDPLEDDELAPRGLTAWEARKIYVQRVSREHSKVSQWHTFWHEYFHVLIDATGRERMARDEVLVDSLGVLQTQAMKTMKF